MNRPSAKLRLSKRPRMSGEDVPLVCMLDSKGNHVLTFDTSRLLETNFPPPTLTLSEEQRRAAVRALYREGDLDFFAEQNEMTRKRLEELLKDTPESEAVALLRPFEGVMS